MSQAEWIELSHAWRRDVAAFDEVAGYGRLQASRPGLAILLLRKGSAVGFIKLRKHQSAMLWNEKSALEAVWRFQPRTFVVPRPLGAGTAAGWHYLASAPLPRGLHSPPRDPPLKAIVQEIEAALAGLRRPPQTPDHWRPMHGDLTPWNLRQLRGGSLVLVDWENAGWGPPQADEVFYRATEAVLRHATIEHAGAPEAVQFWLNRPREQSRNHRDQRLAQALDEMLLRMARS
jgi:thiamine kinase-like enzyme